MIDETRATLECLERDDLIALLLDMYRQRSIWEERQENAHLRNAKLAELARNAAMLTEGALVAMSRELHRLGHLAGPALQEMRTQIREIEDECDPPEPS